MEIHKPVAAFDVDGTLYRSNFLVDLVYQLVRQESFSTRIVDEFSDAQIAWKLERNRDSYVQYMDRLIGTYVKHLKGLSVDELNIAVKRVVHRSPGLMYVYGRNLLKELKETHQLVAISGSPIEVVAPFVNRLGIDQIHATTFEIAKGVYTGEVIHVGTHRKDQTLQRMVKQMDLSFEGSVAMGDTDSDIPMLDLVSRPIAFNPNKELFNHARSHGWEIKLERKDMVYHLGEDGEFSVEKNIGHFRQNG